MLRVASVPKRALPAFLTAFILSTVGSAQSGSNSSFTTGESFIQFRNVSGLPGGGYGVTKDGEQSIRGAMALSTPIAYSLGQYRMAGGLANMSLDSKFRGFSFVKGDKQQNGSGFGTVGFEVGSFRLSATFFMKSRLRDSSFNFHVQLPYEYQGTSFGLGIQDLSGKGGAASQGQPVDNNNSRSVYGVATHSFGHEVFASVGVGTRRFKGVFGNVSFSPADRWKAALEFDTFNWNYIVGYEFPEVKAISIAGHGAKLTLTAGYERGSFPVWTATLGF